MPHQVLSGAREGAIAVLPPARPPVNGLSLAVIAALDQEP